jgi:Tol biopolymer transport system component
VDRSLWLGCALAAVLASVGRAQVTQRVSVDSNGVEANNYSLGTAISGDGRYVAFTSNATNLVPGDTNAVLDVFVRDRQTGITEIASVDSNGTPGNGGSDQPAISADGRYVAFVSSASNLAPGDTNGMADVFVHDRQTGTTELASVSTGGTLENGGSYQPSISADGRYVAFGSVASNLVTGDANGMFDIFVRDRQTGTTELVSVSTGGAQGNSNCFQPTISADGRYVAFGSYATNLVTGDTNGAFDAFVHDRQTGSTVRASVGSGGLQANSAVYNPTMSSDGRYVAFSSIADNLVPGDTNTDLDVFVHDLQTGTTERASLDSTGAQGNGDSGYYNAPTISLSSDGRYVAFSSEATNLVPGTDANGFELDVFVRDRQAATTERVSVSSSGAQGNNQCEAVSISGDGRFVAWDSAASNFVPGDTNGTNDIFVHDRLGGTSFTSLCDPGVDGVLACPCSNSPSGSGRGCNNSAATGGAILAASGGAYLSSDSLVFTTSGEKPTATSVLLQGTTQVSGGATYGQGVRCLGGTLKRLYTKAASGGSVTCPNYGAGDPTVSARSAAKGNPIGAGQSRWYLVFYRDPIVLGGCPSTSTFNATQTARVDWTP